MTTEKTVDTLDDESYDPFEAFDQALGADRVRNPYPKFAELRRSSPVHNRGLWTLFELADPASVVFGESKSYAALSYNAVTQILRDSKIFTSGMYADVMGPVMGHSILEMDEPEHTSYRELLEQAFNRKVLQRWEDEVIRPQADSFIDKFVERGSVFFS